MKKWSMLQQAFQKGSVDAEQCLVYTVNDFQVKKNSNYFKLIMLCASNIVQEVSANTWPYLMYKDMQTSYKTVITDCCKLL